MGNRSSNMGSKNPEVQKISSIAEKEKEVIEIDDCCASPDQKGTPSRLILTLKNRDQIKKYEETEDCFILDFDPCDEIEGSKHSLYKDFDNAGDTDLSVVAEKGQVACRDYPHPRHTCAKYPFDKTPHSIHCERCYCYVCDTAAPCKMWVGSSGHCHAHNTAAWENEKIARRLLSTTM